MSMMVGAGKLGDSFLRRELSLKNVSKVSSCWMTTREMRRALLAGDQDVGEAGREDFSCGGDDGA